MSGIKVFAPASVGNVGVGFDVLGMAIEKPGDEVIASFSNQKGLRITKITGAQGRLPFEPEKNTAGVAILRFLESIGEQDRGIDIQIHKKMPLGSGLGSSAASAVGGVFAVASLLRLGLSKRDLLPFACAGEAIAAGGFHADNVAPSLLGGIVLVRDNATLDVHRILIPPGLFVTVVYPHIEVLTKDARKILSPSVPLSAMVEQSGNLAGFVLGLCKGDVGLVGRSLKDVVIEPQRAALIPGFEAVKDAALTAGAMGCSISGAGPSMFALSSNSLIAEEVGLAMQAAFKTAAKLKSDLFVSPINQEGAIIL